ncbi:MAG: hypothetical protein H7836_04270 [Magnetococcus sp. YQC-3]
MNKEILEAIAKTLPAMQAEILQRELTKAAAYDELKKKFDELAQVHKDATKIVVEYENRRQEIKDLELQLKAKTKEYEDGKRDLELKMVKHELQCQMNVKQDLKDLMYAAFRNPTIHKSFSKSVPVNNMGWTTNVQDSETTTQE